MTREAQETVNLKSRELEEEKKRREELEKQLEEMKREREEAAERERRERREKTPGGRATVSEIAHEYENLNKNNTSYTNNSTINRTPQERRGAWTTRNRQATRITRRDLSCWTRRKFPSGHRYRQFGRPETHLARTEAF